MGEQPHAPMLPHPTLHCLMPAVAAHPPMPGCPGRARCTNCRTCTSRRIISQSPRWAAVSSGRSKCSSSCEMLAASGAGLLWCRQLRWNCERALFCGEASHAPRGPHPWHPPPHRAAPAQPQPPCCRPPRPCRSMADGRGGPLTARRRGGGAACACSGSGTSSRRLQPCRDRDPKERAPVQCSGAHLVSCGRKGAAKQ